MPEQCTCFVVQGFGEKTDLTNGRKLNLDASYLIIKEAAQDAGLRCLRADEIVHAGNIDQAMYQWIFEADLVIADLSTYNINAAYELGIRYGVRPGATIIVAEEQFKNPFDVSHIVIRTYKHLGDDVGAQEARRFKKDLTKDIKAILAKAVPDSPVYTFLNLKPPTVKPSQRAATPRRADRLEAEDTTHDQSAKELLDQARSAMAADNFALAKNLFAAIHAVRPRDEYVVQQLALATYKRKLPNLMTALTEAHALLQTLNPASTNDPETLGLWGAVHKQLWDLTEQQSHLDTAIDAYERGFSLKQDYYNGINLAFLLNVRAGVASRAGDGAEAIADFVLARRIRRQVVALCKAALLLPASGLEPLSSKTTDVAEERYWIMATLWEAAVGLEDEAEIAKWQKEAQKNAVAKWMFAATKLQVAQLAELLTESPLDAFGLQ